jgi:hypothetical protein
MLQVLERWALPADWEPAADGEMVASGREKPAEAWWMPLAFRSVNARLMPTPPAFHFGRAGLITCTTPPNWLLNDYLIHQESCIRHRARA